MKYLDLSNQQILYLTYEYLDLWWETKSSFPTFKKTIGLFHKLKNERKLEHFRKSLTRELKSMEGLSKDNGWSKGLINIIKEMEGSIIGYEKGCIDFFINRGYSNITEGFLQEVNEFDPEMDTYDIFQAIRNVWIMNSIQILMNEEVALTPSIFSYSMLYPYSDNYLDNTEIQLEDKMEFNSRFRRWLKGVKAEAINRNEEKIYELVKKIEGEYPRGNYNEVYESLLAIHAAQEKSLLQQRFGNGSNEKSIIEITFEKGGTSVLADGYLVKGKLMKEEADFMFGYGVFLQLIDDLQDVEEDLKSGNRTLFSQTAHKTPLDQLTNKLFWLIEEILINRNPFTSEEALGLRYVIYESCRIMIFEAISKNRRLYSKKYIKEIEKYSMLRFGYYKKIKRKFQKSFTSEDLNKICHALVIKPQREEKIIEVVSP